MWPLWATRKTVDWGNSVVRYKQWATMAGSRSTNDSLVDLKIVEQRIYVTLHSVQKETEEKEEEDGTKTVTELGLRVTEKFQTLHISDGALFSETGVTLFDTVAASVPQKIVDIFPSHQVLAFSL